MGNRHASTFPALIRDLAERGHDVLFLERDLPWYAGNRGLPRRHSRMGIQAMEPEQYVASMTAASPCP